MMSTVEIIEEVVRPPGERERERTKTVVDHGSGREREMAIQIR